MRDTIDTTAPSGTSTLARLSGTAWLCLATLLVALIGAQAWYSSLTTSRMLYEELAESVRNPVWIAHRLVYDGVSSNVAWYALLAASYKLVGFSLIAGKVLRVVFQALSLACLVHLLVRWLGWRATLLPLAVIGLSPVVLFFNTMSTVYGIDLQWAPVIVWLLWHAGVRSTTQDLAIHAALGLCAVIGCLMWPVCVFYVPIWMLIYLVRQRTGGVTLRPVAVWTAAVFAAVPFLVAVAWLHNADTFLHDPATGSGVFRGGGAGFVHSARAFASNMWRVARDLTMTGSSYYFWVPRPDLSGFFGLVPAFATVSMLPELWRSRRDVRLVVTGAVLVGGAATVLAAVAAGPPGVRRATMSLAVFYLLYVLCWALAIEGLRRHPSRWRPKAQAAALSLLLVHHGLAFVPNGGALQADVPATERHWFGREGSPQKSVEHWADIVAAGGALDCRMVSLPPTSCRYAEVYAAVTGYLHWSRGRSAVTVRAFDFESGVPIPVSPEAWPSRLRR